MFGTAVTSAPSCGLRIQRLTSAPSSASWKSTVPKWMTCAEINIWCWSSCAEDFGPKFSGPKIVYPLKLPQVCSNVNHLKTRWGIFLVFPSLNQVGHFTPRNSMTFDFIGEIYIEVWTSDNLTQIDHLTWTMWHSLCHMVLNSVFDRYS